MTVIAGIGNPLLDITVTIVDKTILQKYNLNEDDAQEIPKNEIKALIHDIAILKPQFSPGGATQNTLRLLQWILKKPHSTIMFGAIGQDAQGEILQDLVEAAGVTTRYVEHNLEPTGTVVALVNGKNRALAAYVGAAHHITSQDLQTNHNDGLLKTADLIYMEAFFIPHRQDAAKYVHQFCNSQNKIFGFNIGAPYIIAKFAEDILYFVENCDIVIGNRQEYEALLQKTNTQTNAEVFIRELSKNYKNLKNLQYGKIVVMTNNANSIFCAHSGGEFEELSVPKMDNSKILDTTGAGDAFAAGFLAGMFKARHPTTCLKWGCWVAQQIIQLSGCTIPTYTAEPLENIE